MDDQERTLQEFPACCPSCEAPIEAGEVPLRRHRWRTNRGHDFLVRFRLMKQVAYFLLILNRASFLEAAGVVLKIGLSLKPVVKHWSKEMNDS